MTKRAGLTPSRWLPARRWSAAALAAGTTPHSVLNQLTPSPIRANLSAPSQRDRLLPNGFQLGNYSNASSEPTTQSETNLKMLGQNR